MLAMPSSRSVHSLLFRRGTRRRLLQSLQHAKNSVIAIHPSFYPTATTAKGNTNMTMAASLSASLSTITTNANTDVIGRRRWNYVNVDTNTNDNLCTSLRGYNKYNNSASIIGVVNVGGGTIKSSNDVTNNANLRLYSSTTAMKQQQQQQQQQLHEQYFEDDDHDYDDNSSSTFRGSDSITSSIESKEEPNYASLLGSSSKLNLFTSINSAMRIAMQSDPSAIVFGEDVAFGGVFRCSQNLREEFGDARVFNTPLSENGIAVSDKEECGTHWYLE